MGWPSHWDVGQPLNRQHDKGGNQSTPAVKPGGSSDLLPPSPPAEKVTSCKDQAGKSCKTKVRLKVPAKRSNRAGRERGPPLFLRGSARDRIAHAITVKSDQLNTNV